MASSASLEVHDLCKKCQTIDLEEIFSRRYPGQGYGTHVLDLGPFQALAKGCALCRFFATMGNAMTTTTNCELLLTSSKSSYFNYGGLEEFKELDDTILLYVWPSPPKSNERIYFSSVQPTRSVPHIGFRIICPEKFDKDFVRDSISYCSAYHLSVCQPHIIDTPDFFRLIDCKARQVIVAQPGCEYLALSYVWGTTTQTSTGSLGDLDNCPKVIIDSMDVTLNLAFRYLWVDRYCIDQLDDEDKQHQIRQMDLIYANAVATIIAAAGDGPEYGLPGVNGTLRKHQPRIHVCGNLLASTLPHPSRSVSDSKWATRGWTYQEGILSKRRIVFTDDQVIFECNGMHTLESHALPLDVLHTSDKGRFRKEVNHGAFEWKTPGADIMPFLAEFSRRELTHSADALNAMQGIFQMFLKAKTPIYHIEGVPLVPRKSRAFVLEHSFIQGLSWYHKNPGERRPEFPSWSWAGWTGLLADRVTLNPRRLRDPYDISIRLEYENEIIEDFPKENEWQDFLPKIATIRVKFLHIKGQTLKCSLVRTANEFDVGLQNDSYIANCDYFLKLEVEKNTVVYAFPWLDLDGAQIEGKPLKSIRLCPEVEKKLSWFERSPSLLIATNTNGVSERVGIFYDLVCCMQDGKLVFLEKEDVWDVQDGGGRGTLDKEVIRGLLEKKLQLRTIRLG
jgi:hypothetical protein